MRRSVHPGPSGDANADANWESEPVGCCRSDGPEGIQETVPDGASQTAYAFWKCGWCGNRHESSNPSRSAFPLQYKGLRLTNRALDAARQSR